MKRRALRTPVLMALILLPVRMMAQYYEEVPRLEPFSDRYISAGIGSWNFRPAAGNPAADSVSARYTSIMPVLAFHQGMVDLALGYTTYSILGSSRSAITFNTTVRSEFVLAGTPRSALVLPVAIAADYTKSQTRGAQRDEFNIGSIGIGTGIKARFRGDVVDVSLHAIAFAQLSFEGWSVGTGFSPAAIAETTFLFRQALWGDGLVLGYRLRYQSWSMSRSELDYRVLTHGPYIGILF